MYDYLECQYALPVTGGNELRYQTQSTPAQWLDYYRIDKHGQLWHEDYDIEDHSDPTAEGFERLIGMLDRVNKRWTQIDFIGEIRFYTSLGENHMGWIEWSTYFVNGKLNQIHLLEHRLSD